MDKKERLGNKKVRYLERVKYLENSITELELHLKAEEQRKQQVKAINYAKEQIKGGNKDSWEALIDKADSYRESIVNSTIKLTELKNDILNIIMTVKNDRFRLLLILRYVRCYPWDVVEEKMDIPTNTRIKWHSQALRKLYIPNLR